MKLKRAEAERAERRGRGAFAVLGVLLVILGQTILYTTVTKSPTGLPSAMILSLVGAVLFVLSLLLPLPEFMKAAFVHLPVDGPAGWISVAIVLSLLAVISQSWFGHIANLNYLPVLTLWLGSAACLVAAFARPDRHGRDWKVWLREHRWELAAAGGATLLAAGLRFYRLGAIPRVLNGDEGMLGLVAQQTVHDPLSNPFALWNNNSALYLQAINTIFGFFGTTSFALRLLPAIAGVLSIPMLYLFGRQVAGRRAALIAALLLAFSHFDLNFSRTSGGDYIFSTLFTPLILYLMLVAVARRSRGWAALAGAMLAIFFCTYQMAQLLIGLTLVLTLGVLVLPGWRKASARLLPAFWTSFAIPVLPEAVYIARNPQDFLARLSSSGTFQTGWLAQTVASSQQPAVLVLAQRVLHAFLSLVYYPSISFYGVNVPPLTLLTASFFLIGLALCLVRTRDHRYLVLNGYFWGFTLAIGIFAIPPDADTYHMLVVLPAALLMAAVGLEAILSVVGLAWERTHVGYALITSLLLASLLATNLWTYYGEFAGRCLYADNTIGRFASYMGSYARTIPPEQKIYLLSDAQYLYGTHASTDFLSGRHPIINVPDPVDSLTPQAGEAILASPDRFEELEGWAAAHPGGQLLYTYDCSNLILVVYRFP